VLPALLRKTHEAMMQGDKTITVWGSGKPMREFLHVSDMDDACVFLMEPNISSGLYNIGTGSDVSIKRLAEVIMKTIGYSGDVVFDTSKPDGTPRKWLDVSRMAELGWRAQISLEDGIKSTYHDYVKHATKPRHFYLERTSHMKKKAHI
jgi:GDP-L-fucose synthase